MKAAVQIFVIAGVILVSGCATPYHPAGFMGGFSETQLAPDVFRVTFRGNGYTSDERAQDFAMLRASELSLQNGFTCFAIIDERDSSTPFTVSTPGHSYTTGTAYVSGNNVSYTGHTTYSPGYTFTFFKPKTGLLFRCFQAKPDAIFTFDASFLKNSVRQKYRLKQP